MNERIVCEASPRIAAAELRVSAILYQAICTALLWAERVRQRRHLAGSMPGCSMISVSPPRRPRRRSTNLSGAPKPGC